MKVWPDLVLSYILDLLLPPSGVFVGRVTSNNLFAPFLILKIKLKEMKYKFLTIKKLTIKTKNNKVKN